MRSFSRISCCLLVSGMWAAAPAAAQSLCGTTTSTGAGQSFASAGWQLAFGTDGGGNLDADPKIGPLKDNGGNAATLMHATGSPAIDAGLDSACNAAPVNARDQRGIVRPLGAHCDIGAVEATQLNLNVTDGVALGFYGKALQYVVTLQNLSATDTVSGVHVSGLGTAALDGPGTLWFCAAADFSAIGLSPVRRVPAIGDIPRPDTLSIR